MSPEGDTRGAGGVTGEDGGVCEDGWEGERTGRLSSLLGRVGPEEIRSSVRISLVDRDPANSKGTRSVPARWNCAAWPAPAFETGTPLADVGLGSRPGGGGLNGSARRNPTPPGHLVWLDGFTASGPHEGGDLVHPRRDGHRHGSEELMHTRSLALATLALLAPMGPVSAQADLMGPPRGHVGISFLAAEPLVSSRTS
jgi:hypothetical protein